MEYNYDAYIGSIKNQGDMNFENQATTNDNICAAHLRSIANICKIVIIFSCTINMNYIDLNLVQEARVTFEADNNLEFRLGTGAFRYTKKAKENDLALITRLSKYDYEMRIVSTDDQKYHSFQLMQHHISETMGNDLGI